MIPFTTEDQKAFYDVVDSSRSSIFVNKLGYCFKMNYQPDDQFPGQRMWVTSSKILSELEKSQKTKFFAERCKKGKEGVHELVVAELNTTDAGIAFINCNTDEDHKENFLRFGYYKRALPDEAFAYVFDGKKMLGLRFVKTGDGAVTYTLDSSSSDKPSDTFKIREAVGAPIIVEVYPPNRNQVVGILNIEANGTLKPVFFDRSTFDLDPKFPSEGNFQKSPSEGNFQKSPSEGNFQKSPSEGNYQKSPSEGNFQKSPSEGNYQKSPSEESNGDKTDSPTHASKESANGDEKDSPIAAFKDSANDDKTDSPGSVDALTETVQQMQLDEKTYNAQQPTQEDKPKSTGETVQQIQLDEKKYNAQQPTQEDKPKSTGELAISKASSSILLPPSHCIKKQTLEISPITHQLTQKLKIYLDPKKPMGKDYQDLADSFDYNSVEIQYLGTRDSPTVTLLEEENWCTIEQLLSKLKDMGRDDAVRVIDKLVKKQGCNCENCCDLC